MVYHPTKHRFCHIFLNGLPGYWNSDTGASEMMPGKGHSNQVQDMAVVDGKLVTVGMDDSLIVSDAESKEYG